MQDFAREASVALSSFAQVLAITEGLHDVHSLGKETAAVHSALMHDLSKANTVLLPLESVLSKDVIAMTDTISADGEAKMDIPPIHGQAIYQSYCSRIREALKSLKPMVPSLSVSVKELHSMLTMLARTASLHAGNLHKALEGLGESSQKIILSSTDLENDDALFDKEGDLSPEINSNSKVELPNAEGLSLEDEEWISLPDSIYDSSSVSDNSSFETSQCNDDEISISEQFQQDPKYSNDQENSLHVESEFVNTVPDTVTSASDFPSDRLEATSTDVDTSGENLEEMGHEGIVGTEIVDEEKDGLGKHGSQAVVDIERRVKRGKNAYAMMVLRRVEMKLDGRDIDSNREISVSEQVDYLLKQATSVDNLCNMYEGWTPWI